MKILAIETSCDETAASLLEVKGDNFILHSNVVASQINIHKKTGGIVPEVAASEHTIRIIPVIKKVVKNLSDIDIIAVTSGPGLITSLIVGVETAKALAYSLNRPLVAVNHLEGHLYSSFLPRRKKQKNFKLPKIAFPALALIVSGGHTQLVLLKKNLKPKIIGETLDDAAGEAFDKVAKILKLGYPGGPIIEKLAKQGNSSAFNLPRPMINHKNFNFSFSGLKTAVLYITREQKIINSRLKKNLATSFQKAVFEVLIKKSLKAANQYKIKTIMLGGGVIANQTLKGQFKKAVKKFLPAAKLLIPPPKYCTDNAAMIALAAYFHAFKKDFVPLKKIKAEPNLGLD